MDILVDQIIQKYSENKNEKTIEYYVGHELNTLFFKPTTTKEDISNLKNKLIKLVSEKLNQSSSKKRKKSDKTDKVSRKKKG